MSPVMARSISSDSIQEEPAQTYVPRLQYRQTGRPATAGASSRGTIPIKSPTISSARVDLGPLSPGISSSSSAARPSKFPHALKAIRTSRSPRTPSRAPSPAPSLRKLETPSKSKASALFNFFSVKEPSQKALEEYERRIRTNGLSNDARIMSAGIPGVSSAKMPATVPKVNSNWDGVPQVMKDQEKENKWGGQPFLAKYSRSISTARSDESKMTTWSATSSHTGLLFKPGSSRFDSGSHVADIYGWESAGTADESGDKLPTKGVKRHNKGFSRSSRSGQMTTLSYPPLPPPVPASYLDMELPPLASAVANGRQESPLASGESLPQLPAYSTSSTATSAVSSPVTPLDFDPIASDSACQLGHLTDNQHLKTTTLRIPARDEVMIRSAGFEILDPPAMARRNGKRSTPVVADEQDQSDLPDHAVMADQHEISDLGSYAHPGGISGLFSDPPPGSSAQVETNASGGSKPKKWSKIPMLFGK